MGGGGGGESFLDPCLNMREHDSGVMHKATCVHASSCTYSNSHTNLHACFTHAAVNRHACNH